MAEIPELTLQLEAFMMQPPKPIGFAVMNGRAQVGVMTIEELEAAIAKARPTLTGERA